MDTRGSTTPRPEARPEASSTAPKKYRHLSLAEMEEIDARHEDEMFARIEARQAAKAAAKTGD